MRRIIVVVVGAALIVAMLALSGVTAGAAPQGPDEQAAFGQGVAGFHFSEDAKAGGATAEGQPPPSTVPEEDQIMCPSCFTSPDE